MVKSEVPKHPGHGVNTPCPGRQIAGSVLRVTQCLPRHRFTLAAGVRPGAAAASHRSRVPSRRSVVRQHNWGVCARRAFWQTLVVCAALFFAGLGLARASTPAKFGLASWYGEEHCGKLMANGKRFNPNRFTAASWFYPLGTKVAVTLASASQPRRTVVVTITDRGPAKELVRDGRIIDLSHAPFKELAPPYLGLVTVAVQPLP